MVIKRFNTEGGRKSVSLKSEQKILYEKKF